MKQDEQTTTRRRDFLKTVAVAGTAAGVAATSSTAVADQPEPGQARTDQGYRETDHIRTYYRLAQV